MMSFFETVASVSGDPKRTSAWIQQDVMRTLKERDWNIDQFPVSAQTLGELLKQVHDGQLDNARARDVFQYLLKHGGTVQQATAELGIEAVDDSELDALCDELLSNNPQVVEHVKGGKPQAIGALIGQAKQKNPNVNPGQLRATLLAKIEAM